MADASVRNNISTEDFIDERCFYSHIGPSGIQILALSLSIPC